MESRRLNTVTSGTVAVDGFGGLGICPQRNVLWDNLTAFEHVQIFNRLKSTGTPSTKIEIHELIAACDLDRKVDAQSRTLSGGQKRKLQLSMMFTGGSRVCCVDECSSGVDALARYVSFKRSLPIQNSSETFEAYLKSLGHSFTPSAPIRRLKMDC